MTRRPRLGRALLVVTVGFLLATAQLAFVPPPPSAPEASRIEAEPVSLNPERSDDRTLGPLHYLDGWSLRSPSRWFGGLSAIGVGPDRVIALSDAGLVMTFDRPDRAGGRLVVAPLEHVPGSGKVDRDAEALATDGRSLWVAFERRNQIWRYRADGLRPEAYAAPEAMSRWPWNSGAESLARLPGGRFLLIAEHRNTEGASPALLFLGDPAEPSTEAVPLSLRPPGGYHATDAAALPDGRLLILTRRFSFGSFFTAKLLLAQPPPAEAGAQIEAREIAAFEGPLIKDNLEGVAVTVEDGRTIVWLASDDNYLPMQRTLLLKFEWAG